MQNDNFTQKDIDIILNFQKEFLTNQQDLDPYIQKILNDNFWDLIEYNKEE